MTKVPYRRCRLCRAALEPGDPYFAHHAGPFVGVMYYCEACITFDATAARRAARRTINRIRREAEDQAVHPEAVQAERSEPSGKP